MLLYVLMFLVFLGASFYITVASKKKVASVKVDAISAGSAGKENQTAEIKIKGRTTIDISNFIIMLVCGRSMEYVNIEDKDAILVEQYNDASILKPHKSIISVDNTDKAENIKHKLRKYIGVFENADDVQGFAQSNDLDIEIFQNCYEERTKKDNGIKELIQQNKKIVVSETTIEDKNFQRHYSFHSADSVEGVVKYAIPSKYVEVINRY